MNWYLKDILIYGSDNAVRQVSFLSGVNIVTGESGTGKSALIPIVDYCLGSKECDVPKRIIRNFAQWYAIRIQTPQEQIFLARKSPGSHLTSNIMHIIIEQDISIPSLNQLIGNSDRHAIIEELSRRLGMMDKALMQSVYDIAYTEPPTVRSVMPLLFQPQNVIANKDVLFYKTDEERHSDHRKRLQRIFPFVLGAIDAEYFSMKSELEITNRLLRQSERSLREQQALLDGGISVARSLFDQAIALGIASEGSNTTLDVTILRSQLTNVLGFAEVESPREPVISGDPERVAYLQKRSRELRTEISSLRSQLVATEELAQEALQFTGTLNLQSGRLRVVNLLPEGTNSTNLCPICNQHLNGSTPNIERLRIINNEVNLQLKDMTVANPALTTHIDKLRSQIDNSRRQLVSVESELTELYRTQESSSSVTTLWAEQQRHLGAIRFYLERVPQNSQDISIIEQRVAEQRQQVRQLEEMLSNFDTDDRLQSALYFIAQTMTTLSKRLNLEAPDANLRLDINKLTVIRDSLTGKPERLYEIGSGENWVGYHLCALFALHTFFIYHQSPVPSFIFIDQPTQIYFPEEGASVNAKDTDWDAVRRMYTMIFDIVEELNNQLQVIILDHAELEETRFKQAIRVRWRDGRALI